MSDEAAFLAAIAAAPADDAPRLVYADWLDEHGQSDQAEMIRAEQQYRHALARVAELRPRLDPDWLHRVLPRLFPAGELVIRSYPPDRKIHVIKVIRQFTGRGLAESKALSESLPVRLKGNGSAAGLVEARAELLQVGADVDNYYVGDPPPAR